MIENIFKPESAVKKSIQTASMANDTRSISNGPSNVTDDEEDDDEDDDYEIDEDLEDFDENSYSNRALLGLPLIHDEHIILDENRNLSVPLPPPLQNYHVLASRLQYRTVSLNLPEPKIKLNLNRFFSYKIINFKNLKLIF